MLKTDNPESLARDVKKKWYVAMQNGGISLSKESMRMVDDKAGKPQFRGEKIERLVLRS